MSQLHQVLARDKDTKTHLNRVITDFYHTAQKKDLFAGLAKTYQPKDEEGDQLPAESVLVQQKTGRVLKGVQDAFAKLFELRATIDESNRHAVAPVILNGTQVTEPLPTTHLLFLEKQVNDIGSIVEKLPTLDPAHVWTWNSQEEVWQTEELKTARTVKKDRFVSIAKATDKHPEQVAKVTDDIQVGMWTTRKLSGAIPASEKAAMLARVAQVKSAVKSAIATANMVTPVEASSSTLLDYIFAG